MYYEIHGDGPPLVLVMGIGYDSSLWTLQQVPVLSTRFRVVLLENRDAGRGAVDPIAVWNWVKAHDPSGEVFGGQQLTWLFSTAFRRNRQAVQETVDLLRSNPNPVEPAAYDRQARACLPFDARDRLGGIAAATLVVAGEQDLLTPPLGHTSCRWSARTTSTGW